ncbi:rod shape-determining protein RodA [Massilibacteroides vaginae]|uniref:rod shape-determining protein RodA n=1 Tax=Massilibacteroides vaginae TaxID=1673718 RepID=UPI000A1C96EE|nr:rod shape-determining protein RodA [Massilibacteroides vaginae]
MSIRKVSILKSIDWLTILFYIIMVIAGWFTICGASYEYDSMSLFDVAGRPGSQLLWIGLSVGLVFIIMMLDKDIFDVFAYFIYFIIVLLLIATIFLAPDIKGSGSWLVLGPVRLQPAEFAKFATALAVARFMSQYGFKLNTPKNFVSTLLLIFIPMICILLQKETGSALVYLAFFLVLYREGMSGKVLLIGCCAVLFFVTNMKFLDVIVGITPLGELIVTLMILVITTILTVGASRNKGILYWIVSIIAFAFLAGYIVSLLVPVNFYWIALALTLSLCCYLLYLAFRTWIMKYALIAIFALGSIAFLFSIEYVFDNILEPHHQVRIKVSLGLEDDPTGAGYNVNQSKIAIGSGGLTGKGFLNGTQTKLKYVPEQETDFIFCTIGEEHGFVGSTLVVLLFSAFIIRLIQLAERQETAFARIYGYSVASIFLFHLVINIGMVIGLTPVIGIPLPFFSYGGSSLLGFTILLFIFLRLDSSRRGN